MFGRSFKSTVSSTAAAHLFADHACVQAIHVSGRSGSSVVCGRLLFSKLKVLLLVKLDLIQFRH